MRRFLIVVAVVAMVVFGHAPDAIAQTCRGTVALGTGGARGIGGTAVAFNSSVASYGGFIGGGSDTLFGLGSVAVNHYDELGVNSWSAGGTIGGQVAADAARKTVICPFGFVSSESASDLFDTGIDEWDLAFGSGVSVGFVAASTPTVSVVPAVAFTVGRIRSRLSGFGESEVYTDTAGSVSVGVGLVLNERTSITPAVSVPIGVEDGKTSFALTVAFGFGGR